MVKTILSQAAFYGLLLIFIACWLSRWKYSYYEDFPVRVNRFSGTTEMRIQNAPKDVEWIILEDFKDGKPLDATAGILSLPPQNGWH